MYTLYILTSFYKFNIESDNPVICENFNRSIYFSHLIEETEGIS